MSRGAAPSRRTSSSFTVAAQSRRLLATYIAVTAIVFASASHSQPTQVSPADGGSAPQNARNDRPSVDPQTLSCSALKHELNTAGELAILSGPKGAWGDTFYGPAVPRCPFWQIPYFTYVRARDGLCGVGYICIDKPTVN